MEVAVELEDDIFFQELSKQISLLIMDEDEEDPLASSSADSLQSFSGAIYNHHPPPQSALIFHEQLALRRSQIKGTGVFIPQQSTTQQAQPRRKQRKGRSSSSSSYAKYQKQSQEEDTRMVSFQPRSGQAGSFCKTS